MSRTKTDQRLIDDLGNRAERRLKELDALQAKYNTLVEVIFSDDPLIQDIEVSTAQILSKIGELRFKDGFEKVIEELRKEIDYLRQVNLALTGDATDMNQLRDKMARETYDRNKSRRDKIDFNQVQNIRGF